MPFVIVTNVRIEDVDKGREVLQQGVIPFMKSQDGFVQGTWAASRDEGTGVSMVKFDSREHADAALNAMRTQGQRPPGVTIESTAVYEVEGEA